MIAIAALDHLVLTVTNLDTTADFYARVLGMEVEIFGPGRMALRFGRQKINLHPQGQEFQPHAHRPTPGAADLCFLTAVPLATVMDHLRRCGVSIEAGPIERTGAIGPLVSVYFRDPDQNLIEVATPLPRPASGDSPDDSNDYSN